MRIEIIKERCTGCGVCVSFCPFEVLELKEITADYRISEALYPEHCTACYTCQGQCDENAIFIEQV